MLKQSQVLSGLLALSLLAAPGAALADGIVQLNPLMSSSGLSTPASTGETMPLRGRVTTIPAGALLMVKLNQPVSSFSNHLGEPILATLENDVFINDALAIPAGSEVQGQVTNISKSGRAGKHGSIELRFVSIKTPDQVMIPIRAHVVTSDETGILRGNTYAQDIAKGVGIAVGGTAAGAVLGTATGGLLGVAGTGAVFGTALGGIAGVSYALLRQGQDVVLPSGVRMSIVTDGPVAVNP